jgi:hypothetical protein
LRIKPPSCSANSATSVGADDKDASNAAASFVGFDINYSKIFPVLNNFFSE